MEFTSAGFLIIIMLCGNPVGYSGSAEGYGVAPFYITEGYRAENNDFSNLVVEMSGDKSIRTMVHDVTPDDRELFCPNGV